MQLNDFVDVMSTIHVPGVRNVDPLRTGNAPLEQIGHRQQTRHVEATRTTSQPPGWEHGPD